MNEHSLNDPVLKSFEARLAAAAPRLPAAQERELLYQCGLAAGRAAGRKSLRSWQAAAAALLAACLAVSLPVAGERVTAALQTQKAPAAGKVTPRPSPWLEPAPFPSRQVAKLDLDAWQTDESTGPRAAQMQPPISDDPHLRSLTVGALTRAALTP
jgi:hypothetical protein